MVTTFCSNFVSPLSKYCSNSLLTFFQNIVHSLFSSFKIMFKLFSFIISFKLSSSSPLSKILFKLSSSLLSKSSSSLFFHPKLLLTSYINVAANKWLQYKSSKCINECLHEYQLNVKSVLL
jgi:hypothetical protein